LTALKLLVCASLPAISEDEILCTKVLDTASDLGIRGIEIKLGRDDLLSSHMRSWLGEVLSSYDYFLYTHLPYLQGECNLASPNSSRASRARKVIIESIEFSASLGCRLVNSHLGVRLGDGPYIPRAASRLVSIARESRDYGIEISVENQESNCNGIINAPKDIEVLIECYPEVRLTYDAGHGNTQGFGVADYLPVVIERLSYLHLHDNNGEWDEHLALGRGNLDLPLLMLELSKLKVQEDTIPLTLELAALDLGPSLKYLNNIARKGVTII
jgi:sugar phosphate isomerase/epimerase